ncbi:hypothetical protein D3C73_930320 [compost metagenome]
MALTQPQKPPDLQSSQCSTHHLTWVPILLGLAVDPTGKRLDDLAVPFQLARPYLRLQLLQRSLVYRQIDRHIAIQLHDQKLKNAADIVQPFAKRCTEIELPST